MAVDVALKSAFGFPFPFRCFRYKLPVVCLPPPAALAPQVAIQFKFRIKSLKCDYDIRNSDTCLGCRKKLALCIIIRVCIGRWGWGGGVPLCSTSVAYIFKTFPMGPGHHCGTGTQGLTLATASPYRFVTVPLYVPIPLCPSPLCPSPLCSVPLCPSPMCPNHVVFQSHYVPLPVSLCPSPLCSSPIVSKSLVFQSHCVPVPFCSNSLMYQSPYVPVPTCPAPSPKMSHSQPIYVLVPLCTTTSHSHCPSPLMSQPPYIYCTSPICVHGALHPQKPHDLLSTILGM